MFKKLIAKQAAKKIASFIVRKEAKILAATLLTIGTHKAVQKIAKEVPALKFLRQKKRA
jgi:hypothetical protein